MGSCRPASIGHRHGSDGDDSQHDGRWRTCPADGCRFGCSLGAEGIPAAKERRSYSNGSQSFSLLSIVSPILHVSPGFPSR